jgi:membrane associated rhomboid family serine protease
VNPPTEPIIPGETAVIPARSERQAMDWSLVLASQGIGVAIERDPTSGQWHLLVAPDERGRALAAVKQFHIENRRWAWRQHLPDSDLSFHWGALIWVFVLVLLHALSDELRPSGQFVVKLARSGEWWRAFTAVWLHADVGHLMSNAATGVLVLGLAMSRYGAGLALLIGLLGGAAGNLAGSLWRHGDLTEGGAALGASGMVMACVGMLAAQAASLWRLSRHATRLVVISLLGGCFLFLFLGTDPHSDVAAHAGGFVAGAALGALAALAHASRFNRLAGILFAVLSLGTWALAVLH